jgi:hypothetical protein
MLVIPYTLHVEPKRMKLRSEQDEPIDTMSRTDIEAPALIFPKMEKVLPKRMFERSEKALHSTPSQGWRAKNRGVPGHKSKL